MFTLAAHRTETLQLTGVILAINSAFPVTKVCWYSLWLFLFPNTSVTWKENLARQSQNHRSVEVGRNLWRLSSQALLRAESAYSRFLRAVSSQIFSISKNEDSKTTLGNFSSVWFSSQYKLLIMKWSFLYCTVYLLHCLLSSHWVPKRRVGLCLLIPSHHRFMCIHTILWPPPDRTVPAPSVSP